MFQPEPRLMASWGDFVYLGVVTSRNHHPPLLSPPASERLDNQGPRR